VNGTERRRLNQLMRHELANDLLEQVAWKPRLLDRDLLGTDRICQRWAISIGSGMAVEQWEETPVSRLSPLDDTSAILVDRIILKSPRALKAVIIPWYRGTSAAANLHIKLGITRPELHDRWRDSLRSLRRHFVATNHAELLTLIDLAL
jgi:hypothetical protein